MSKETENKQNIRENTAGLPKIGAQDAKDKIMKILLTTVDKNDLNVMDTYFRPIVGKMVDEIANSSADMMWDVTIDSEIERLRKEVFSPERPPSPCFKDICDVLADASPNERTQNQMKKKSVCMEINYKLFKGLYELDSTTKILQHSDRSHIIRYVEDITQNVIFSDGKPKNGFYRNERHGFSVRAFFDAIESKIKPKPFFEKKAIINEIFEVYNSIGDDFSKKAFPENMQKNFIHQIEAENKKREQYAEYIVSNLKKNGVEIGLIKDLKALIHVSLDNPSMTSDYGYSIKDELIENIFSYLPPDKLSEKTANLIFETFDKADPNLGYQVFSKEKRESLINSIREKESKKTSPGTAENLATHLKNDDIKNDQSVKQNLNNSSVKQETMMSAKPIEKQPDLSSAIKSLEDLKNSNELLSIGNNDRRKMKGIIDKVITSLRVVSTDKMKLKTLDTNLNEMSNFVTKLEKDSGKSIFEKFKKVITSVMLVVATLSHNRGAKRKLTNSLNKDKRNIQSLKSKSNNIRDNIKKATSKVESVLQEKNSQNNVQSR